MKCEICGREYIALGVHLRRKHKVDPKDYKEEHGILLAKPLVDDWLSVRLSESMQSRLKDAEYRAEMSELCMSNSRKNIGKPPREMTIAGKASIANSDKIRHEKYLIKQSVSVSEVLREKGTLLDVRKATGSGPTAAKKMAKIAGFEYSKESAKVIRDARAAATIRRKALERVARVTPYLGTTKSAAEMCRLAGISIRTYKNWLSAGLIARHPNGRGADL